MYCEDIASRPGLTITRDKTIEDAAALMDQHRVGLLVIVDRENPKRPIGVISERDIIRAVASKMPLAATVDKAGTMGNFVFVYKDEPIAAAAVKMRQNKVRHVVVLERNGDLYGVISMRDLVGEKKVLEILARERALSEE